jgi:hypothetical protein
MPAHSSRSAQTACAGCCKVSVVLLHSTAALYCRPYSRSLHSCSLQEMSCLLSGHLWLLFGMGVVGGVICCIIAPMWPRLS